MYFPYLKYGCNFEINSARTAAYVANRCDVCADSIPGAFEVRVNNCDVLNYAMDEAGETVVAQSFTTPAVDAPWSDDSQPESNRFLGFMIENVVKPSHIGRTVTPKISGFGGGILETLRAGAQELEIQVLLFACDEEAMEFGFRYLTNGLSGVGCEEPCTLCDLEYRDSCPDMNLPPTVEDFNRGLWILKNVGVTQAPEWVDAPVRGMDHFVRRARFRLGSEYPWKFKCPVTCTDRDTFPIDGPTEACGPVFETWFCETSEINCPINETSNTGETGIILEIKAGTKTLSGISLEILPDPWGVYDPEDLVPTIPNTGVCDRVYVQDLPGGHILRYDTSIEQVTVTKPGGEVVDGTPYLTFTGNGAPPGFPTVRCGTFVARVIVDECSVSPDTWATIQTVHREL